MDTENTAEPIPVIYSKPACVQCDATYRHLDKNNVPYRVVDISNPDNAKEYEFIKGLGYLQAPVVYVDADNHWSGFRPDELKKLAA